jgi:protein TonB
MTFRKFVAAAWCVVASFAVCAHATVDTTDPSVIHAPIKYPASAVSAGEEGTVLVEAEVDINGRAVGAKISRSSGHADLDAAALRSVAGWSFAPAVKDGKPMVQQVVVPVRFHLNRDATGAFHFHEASSAVASVLFCVLGVLIWAVGFVWSLVLGKRNSVLWLWGMVPLWVVTYPVFVATHWSVAKRNLAFVSLGIALVCLGTYLAPPSYWA